MTAGGGVAAARRVAAGAVWVRGGDGWYVPGHGGVLEAGRGGGGEGGVVGVPAGSRGVFDGSGELVHVVLPGGVSFERDLAGAWSPARSGPGEVIVVKTGGPVRLVSGDGSGVVSLPGESEEVADRGVVVAYRQVRAADGSRLAEPRVFLRDGGGWAEAGAGVHPAAYEGWLAAANQAHEAARTLQDIAARGGLAGLPDEGVRGLLRGSADDAVAAVYEWVRRTRGVALRWTQLAGSHALAGGDVVNMAAGEGKSWLFLVDAARQAVRPGVDAVHVITTRQNLADREFKEYTAVLGGLGFDVRRMNPDREVEAPAAGRPTIYVGTSQDVGFTKLRTGLVPGQDKAVPLLRFDAGVDEVDEAFVYSDSRYILSEGVQGAAPDVVLGPVGQAARVITGGLASGELTAADFGRAEGQVGGAAALTAGAHGRAAALLGITVGDDGRLDGDLVRRLNMAAAAHFEYAENVHYVLHDGKAFIIDQTTHEVLFNPETATESRWNGGLAQAIEAKHGLTVRDDPATSKSVSARELYTHPVYRRVTGASGTAAGKGARFAEAGLSSRVTSIPRYYASRLATAADHVSPGLAAKLDTIAADTAAMAAGSKNQPQLILAHRNDLVAQLSERLHGLGVDHKAIDAKWFLQQGTGRETAFRDIIENAGRPGQVLVINMQGARGVDIPLTPGARELGGMHVRITARSGLSADIDIQAQNRAARSGDPGSVNYYISPDDDAFALSPNPDVHTAIIKYTSARTTTTQDTDTPDPDTTDGAPAGAPDTTAAPAAIPEPVRAGHQAELARAEQALRDLIPRLQADAATRHGLHDPAQPNAPPAPGTAAAGTATTPPAATPPPPQPPPQATPPATPGPAPTRQTGPAAARAAVQTASGVMLVSGAPRGTGPGPAAAAVPSAVSKQGGRWVTVSGHAGPAFVQIRGARRSPARAAAIPAVWDTVRAADGIVLALPYALIRAGGLASVAEHFAAAGRPVLAPGQQIMTISGDAVTGEIGYDQGGHPHAMPSGTWNLVLGKGTAYDGTGTPYDGTVRDLGTASLMTAYARLGLRSWKARASTGRLTVTTDGRLLPALPSPAARAEDLTAADGALAWAGQDAAGRALVATQSGFYLRGEPRQGGSRAGDEAVAAAGFPAVAGAVVWHLHLDPATGHVLTGGRSLPAGQFYDEVMAARQLPQALLVIVGCGAATLTPDGGEPAAQVLARRGGTRVLAPDTYAWTTPDGRVLAAGQGVDQQGRPMPGPPGDWVLIQPGGHRSAGLGPDLLGILHGGLPAGLPSGPPQATRADVPGLGRAVRWAEYAGPGPGSSRLPDTHAPGELPRPAEDQQQDQIGSDPAGRRQRTAGPEGSTDAPAPAEEVEQAEEAGPAQRAAAYLSGDPDADLDAARLRQVVQELAAGPGGLPDRALALVVLQAADDQAVEQMFAGGELAAALEESFPPGTGTAGQLHADLQRFYQRRFGTAQAAVAAGTAQPLAVFPASEFLPELIDEGLADLRASDQLTPARAQAALSERRDADLAQALAGLPPVQAARASRWITQARTAAGWTDQALAYLTGESVSLDAVRLRDLVTALVTGLASDDERWLALRLLRAASSAGLEHAFDPDYKLLDTLEQAIPPGHQLRPDLHSILQQRFIGGREWLTMGRVYPEATAEGTFTPALIHPDLADLPPDREPDQAQLTSVQNAITARPVTDLAWAVTTLQPIQQGRAARWLTGVRVALHATGTAQPQAMTVLDTTLDQLYRSAAADAPGPGQLRHITVTPPGSQVHELRRALDPARAAPAGQAPAKRPAPGPALRPSRRALRQPGQADSRVFPRLEGRPGARPQPSTSQPLPQKEVFRRQLEAAYRRQIDMYTRSLVDFRREPDRVPENLFSLADMGRIAAAAKEQADKLFGHLAAGPALQPDRPGRRGNIHDLWNHVFQKVSSASDDQLRGGAKQELMRYMTANTLVARLLRERNVVPLFDPRNKPQNEAAQIISAVIEELLNDKENNIVGRVLDIYRGKPGEADSANNDIWVQLWRGRTTQESQRELWDKAQLFIHEYLHLLEHPRYVAYRDSLGFGTHASNALMEGVVCLLSEVVWSGVPYWDPAVRTAVEGDYASEPPLPKDQMPQPSRRRYPSMGEVMRLLHVVGDVRNLYAAFFLGDVEKITGPVKVAVMGSPRAPLPAGEVAALVARLNALPAAERPQYRVSLFADAPREVIERLLTEPGADVLTVTTTVGSHAAGRAVAENPGQLPGLPRVETESGFYFPAGLSAPARVLAGELAAARSFLRVHGAVVLHVHASAGAFATAGGALTPAQFHDRLRLPPGLPLILVGCQTAAPSPDGSPSAAAALAAASGRAVVGATAATFTTITPAVITAADAGVDAVGYPVFDPGRPGEWVATWPDGRRTAGLGPDLLASLRDGTVAAYLPGVTATAGPSAAPPTRAVRWAPGSLPPVLEPPGPGRRAPDPRGVDDVRVQEVVDDWHRRHQDPGSERLNDALKQLLKYRAVRQGTTQWAVLQRELAWLRERHPKSGRDDLADWLGVDPRTVSDWLGEADTAPRQRAQARDTWNAGPVSADGTHNDVAGSQDGPEPLRYAGGGVVPVDVAAQMRAAAEAARAAEHRPRPGYDRPATMDDLPAEETAKRSFEPFTGAAGRWMARRSSGSSGSPGSRSPGSRWRPAARLRRRPGRPAAVVSKTQALAAGARGC